jgi:hypothetical protein
MVLEEAVQRHVATEHSGDRAGPRTGRRGTCSEHGGGGWRAGRARTAARPRGGPGVVTWDRRGLVVKAAGWLSLDRQFAPYLRANTVAPSWCGLGCRSRTLMVEYISPWFLPGPFGRGARGLSARTVRPRLLAAISSSRAGGDGGSHWWMREGLGRTAWREGLGAGKMAAHAYPHAPDDSVTRRPREERLRALNRLRVILASGRGGACLRVGERSTVIRVGSGARGFIFLVLEQGIRQSIGYKVEKVRWCETSISICVHGFDGNR